MATNGEPAANGDVEMQEGAPVEQPLIQDPTDPQPPPQTQDQPISSVPEHLSTIQSGNASVAPMQAAATPVSRPSSIPPMAKLPDKPVAHGGPTRQYLNQNITPHLLEGMKYVAAYEPEKPLNWLADFLKERSREVEGT